MLSSGLPVPSGFVIKSEAFDRFLRHNKVATKIGTILEESHSAGFQRLKEMSGQIQNMIMNGIMPDYIEKQIKDEYQDLSIGREAKEIGGAALDLIRAIDFLPNFPMSEMLDFTKKVIDMFAPKLILGISDEISQVGEIEKVEAISELVDKICGLAD